MLLASLTGGPGLENWLPAGACLIRGPAGYRLWRAGVTQIAYLSSTVHSITSNDEGDVVAQQPGRHEVG